MELKDIIEIIILIMGIISGLAKVHWDYKRTGRNFEKLLKVQLRGLENEFMLLRKDFNSGKVDKDFRKNLKNSINIQAATYVKLNDGISQERKDMLMFWGKEINDLASHWYNSDLRGAKNRDKMEKYLQSWIDSRVLIAGHFMNSTIKGVKVLTNKDKEGLVFSELLTKKGLYIKFKILIGTLSRNHFIDEEAIINEFIDFINEFFANFLTHVDTWNILDNKIYDDIQ